MNLKRIYEYLGDDSADLNARARSRCPTCSPPEELPVLPEVVSTPLAVADLHLTLSADAVDSHRFVVATTMPGSGTYPYGLYVALFEAGVDGAPTPVLLDEVIIDPADTFIAIDVVVLTTTKFIVYVQDSAPATDAIRAYVFTIDGSNQLTYAAKQNVGDVYSGNVELWGARISDTKSVLCYQYSVAGATLGYLAGRVITLDPATDIITMGAEGVLNDYLAQVSDMVYSGASTIYYAFTMYDGPNALAYPSVITFDVSSGTPVFSAASSPATTLYSSPTTRAMALIPGTSKLACVQGTLGYNAELSVITAGSTVAAEVTTSETRISRCDMDVICTEGASGDIKLRLLSAYQDANPALPSTLTLTKFTWNGTAFTQDEAATILDQNTGGIYGDIKFTTTGMSDTRYGAVFTRIDRTMQVFVIDTGD